MGDGKRAAEAIDAYLRRRHDKPPREEEDLAPVESKTTD